jgi:hypothetical protein
LHVKRRNTKAKAAVLVLGSVVLLAGLLVVKTLSAPAVSAFSSKSSAVSDKDIYSLLVVEQDQKNAIRTLKLLVVQRTDAKLYALTIPTTTKVDLPGRLGEEELAKVLEIGQSLNYGGTKHALLIESVTKTLNIHIDRYVIASGDTFDAIQKSVFAKDVSLLFPWQYKKLTRDVATNLSAKELYQLVVFVRGLRPENIEELTTTDVADVNLKLRDITLNGAVAKESLGVVILNGTGVSNVARAVADACQNMGMQVALTANAANEYHSSYLITDDASTATVKYLLDYFPELQVMDKRSASATGEHAVERGDVTIIVGFDIQARL